jgi:hypothetical protein
MRSPHHTSLSNLQPASQHRRHDSHFTASTPLIMIHYQIHPPTHPAIPISATCPVALSSCCATVFARARARLCILRSAQPEICLCLSSDAFPFRPPVQNASSPESPAPHTSGRPKLPALHLPRLPVHIHLPLAPPALLLPQAIIPIPTSLDNSTQKRETDGNPKNGPRR